MPRGKRGWNRPPTEERVVGGCPIAAKLHGGTPCRWPDYRAAAGTSHRQPANTPLVSKLLRPVLSRASALALLLKLSVRREEQANSHHVSHTVVLRRPGTCLNGALAACLGLSCRPPSPANDSQMGQSRSSRDAVSRNPSPPSKTPYGLLQMAFALGWSKRVTRGGRALAACET